MEAKPYYWLNSDSRLFLERGYLENGQTPESRIKEIAAAAEKILKSAGFAERFEKYMSLGWYSLSSPIWANFGLERGLPISCFGSYIDDTMESILGKTSEVGMMTKMGGGTSAYFGALRERGATIKSGGKSNGPIHFMELFETVTNVVSQSNVRRGSFAAYLPIDHPDVLEFLQIRDDGNPIQHISLGVTITDKWMKSMIDGDKEKRKVWGKVIQKRFESGYPYLFFSDTVNKNAPRVYQDKKLKINASNLCLVGDTKITISEYASGVKEKTLTLEEFNEMWAFGRFSSGVFVKTIVDGSEAWAEVTASALTGYTDELIEIITESGKTIRCTEDHLILTKNRGWVKAKNLIETDQLVES